METKKAMQIIREIGHAVSVTFVERGIKLEKRDDFVIGMEAYDHLKLRGENELADEAYDKMVLMIHQARAA